MAYSPREGSGALFKSDKGENAARPDYRGDILLGGVLYEVSGWIKPLPSDASKRFMSLAGKPKQSAPARVPSRASYGTEKPGNEPGDDDVPF